MTSKTTETTSEDRTDLRALEDAELDAVTGGWGLINFGTGIGEPGGGRAGPSTATVALLDRVPGKRIHLRTALYGCRHQRNGRHRFLRLGEVEGA